MMAKRRTAEEIEAESIYIDHHGRKGHLVGAEDFQALVMAYEVAEGVEGALDAAGAVEHEAALKVRAVNELLPEAYELAQVVTYRATGGAREPAARLEGMLAQMGGYGAHERKKPEELERGTGAIGQAVEGDRSGQGERADRGGAGTDPSSGIEAEAETYTGGAFSSLTPEQQARELRRRRRLTEIGREDAR